MRLQGGRSAAEGRTSGTASAELPGPMSSPPVTIGQHGYGPGRGAADERRAIAPAGRRRPIGVIAAMDFVSLAAEDKAWEER